MSTRNRHLPRYKRNKISRDAAQLPAAPKKRKEKRYITFRSLRWRVPNAEWGGYLSRGLTERVSMRVARLRAGVDIVWEDGRHMLRDLSRQLEVSIPSSWRLVEQAALFDTRGSRLSCDQLQREVQRQYGQAYDLWEAA